MTTLLDLMDAPGLDLECVAGTPGDLVVESVFVAERLLDLRDAPSKSVAVLGAHVCSAVDGYQFDIALRLAMARGVAALVLADPEAGPVTSTSADTARRFGIAILRQTKQVNLADVVTALDATMRGSAELALRRAVQAFELITPANASDPAALVEDVARVVAADIAVLTQPVGDLTFPVALDGEPDRWVVVRDATARSRPELLLVGRLLAETLAITAEAARRAEELPIRSRAELLSEILDSSAQGRSELLRRARAMGLPIDGWHVVVRIEHDQAEDQWEEVAAFEARQALGRIVLDAVRSDGGTWHIAWAERSLLVIRMYRNDPGTSAVTAVTKSANRALREASLRFPQAVMYCGVGTVHSGATGLINSAAEARAAVAASRTRNRPNTATAFDSLGLRRTLVEWYASHTAQEAVAAVLTPLDRLGGAKAEEAIRTLQVYLDNHGSLSRTAAELHLHRNSVAYRINRIFSELDIDPENPDDWLLLQLACRARGLTKCSNDRS